MISLAYRADVGADAKERQLRKPADFVQATLPEQNGQTREILAKRFGIGMKATPGVSRTTRAPDVLLPLGRQLTFDENYRITFNAAISWLAPRTNTKSSNPLGIGPRTLDRIASGLDLLKCRQVAVVVIRSVQFPTSGKCRHVDTLRYNDMTILWRHLVMSRYNELT